MAIIIFLLGRPGSGKSTAARYIKMMAEDKNLSSCHINDYTFLLEMFHTDQMKPEKERQFAPTQLGGFDVRDFSVLDDVLHTIEQEALKKQDNEDEVILLEFARGDYREAFAQFHPHFLRNAYFLFFEVDVDICVTRVNERSLYPASDDDHFISEKMLRSYYSTENKSYMQRIFPLEYGIDPSRRKVIDNMGDWKEFGNNIKHFIGPIWEGKKPQKQRDTEELAPPIVANLPLAGHEDLVEVKIRTD